MKQCSKCKKVKLLDNFSKFKRAKDGRMSKCKKCESENYFRKKSHFKELAAQNYLDNKEERRKAIQKHYIENKEYIQKRNTERNRSNPERRMISALGKGLARCYKKKNIKESLSNKTIESYLGCSIPEFMNYIESKFQEGMNWNNHGHWHLDHIIPIMSLEKEEYTIDQVQHHTNFQPLWAKENMKKTLTDMEKYWLD